MRIPELRQQIKAADRAHPRRRDAGVGVGEKGEPGTNPAWKCAVVERLDFNQARGDEVIIEAGVVILAVRRPSLMEPAIFCITGPVPAT